MGALFCSEAERKEDKLFGIEKTWCNAVKDAASGMNVVMPGADDAVEKAVAAGNVIDKAVLGDRDDLIRRADEALSAFNG